MVHSFVRTRATWLAYLSLAFYGYLLNIIGPITPFLKDELTLSYTVSSLHFSAFAVGMIGVGLFGHRAINRLGRWNALWVATFGMSVCVLLLVAGHTPLITIMASFLMGLIGSLLLTIIPSILADLYGDARAVALSEANVIGSIFSASAPILVGWFAPTAFGWRAALIVAVLAGVALRFSFSHVTLPPDQREGADDGSESRMPLLFWIYWIALVVSVSVEFCMISWSADYLETTLGVPKANAAQAVSLFLIGMIVGRFATSKLVQRYDTHRVVTLSLSIAAAGFAIYWLPESPLLALVGLFVSGLGVAGLYPMILALAIGASGKSTVRASSVAALGSGIAILALPLTLGRVADAVGIRSAYAVVIVLLIAAFVITQGAARLAHRSPVLETAL